MAISGTIPAVSHVAVTVTDLSVSEAWYTRVYQLGNTLFGLHGFPDLNSKDLFDERKPGLDHVSFGCAGRAGLVEWAAGPAPGRAPSRPRPRDDASSWRRRRRRRPPSRRTGRAA